MSSSGHYSNTSFGSGNPTSTVNYCSSSFNTSGTITMAGSSISSGSLTVSPAQPSTIAGITVAGSQVKYGSTKYGVISYDIESYTTALFESGHILSESFIRSMISEFKHSGIAIDYEALSRTQRLSVEFIRDFSDVLNWDAISKYQHLTSKELMEFKDRINWDIISQCYWLTTKDISKFGELGKINFGLLCWNNNVAFTPYIIKKYESRLDWFALSHRLSLLTDSFVRKYGDKNGFDIRYASEMVSLSEKTVFKYLTKIDFSCPMQASRKWKDDKIACYAKLI